MFSRLSTLVIEGVEDDVSGWRSRSGLPGNLDTVSVSVRPFRAAFDEAHCGHAQRALAGPASGIGRAGGDRMPDPGRLRKWRRPGNHHPKPTASAAAAAEPTSGPAAVAAITANWKTVFDGKAPIPSRSALVQDGPQVAAFVEAQAKTSFGAAATGSTATISSVTITSPTQASVHYEVLLLGTPLLKNQVGTAVYLDGVWKVAIASFCGLAYLEFPKGSSQLPAVCQS